MEYAIVDIETTGSYANGNGITEIAVFVHNGTHIIERFQSLINPLAPIPHHIQVLTGIDEQMVEDAPTFEDIAPKLYDLLNQRIFVAHNVNFDYSFIHQAFKNTGYNWKAPKLCTVRLSRKVFPNLASYSLGKLCQNLGIPIHNRHRAAGDVEATVLLFEQIIKHDSTNLISTTLKKTKEHRLPTHINEEDFIKLPETTGIYLFRNKSGKIIYVGKAVHIKNRVLAHFSGTDGTAKRQSFINEICSIDFEESGTELMALLMECKMIKQHWPKYNSALKKFEPKFGLFHYEDQQGYIRLLATKYSKHMAAIQYFDRAVDANQLLLQLIDEFGLDTQLCQFYSEKDPVISKRVLYDKLESSTSYNDKINEAIAKITDDNISFTMLDKGRHTDEKSYIHYRQNQLYAFGFVTNDNQATDIDDLINEDDRCVANHYMTAMVLRQAKQRHLY